MENKPTIPRHIFFFIFLVLILGVAFIGKLVFGEGDNTSPTHTIIMPTIVNNTEYEWTNDDEIGKLINEAKILPESEKEKVVKQVSSAIIRGPNYTIRVGLQGTRKPIPTITGGTEQERAKEWLEKAGLGYTINTWVHLGEKYKIDYTLPLCIAWSDSHLGKALKSTNNIGNVGNRDDGSVVHYDSLDKGIEAIFRVLNNKYLGGNTELAELSGEGRIILKKNPCTNAPAPKKCYATSTGVWHTNVRNCLSVIHNRDIPNNYAFRL